MIERREERSWLNFRYRRYLVRPDLCPRYYILLWWMPSSFSLRILKTTHFVLDLAHSQNPRLTCCLHLRYKTHNRETKPSGETFQAGIIVQKRREIVNTNQEIENTIGKISHYHSLIIYLPQSQHYLIFQINVTDSKIVALSKGFKGYVLSLPQNLKFFGTSWKYKTRYKIKNRGITNTTTDSTN